MQIQDDRTQKQRHSHTTLVVGTDKGNHETYVETGGGEATQNMYCITCGKTWLDYYKLEGYV